MSKIARMSLCVLLSVALVLSACGWTGGAVAAEETAVQPRYSYTNYTTTDLTFSSGNIANCKNFVKGYYGTTTKIKTQMYLQQYLALQWTIIAAWESTTDHYYADMVKTKTLTSSGNYRVKVVATVYSGSASEQLTLYSPERYFTRT